MLIDRFAPHGDFAERHEIAVDAPPERAWRAVRGLDLGADPVVKVLLMLRGMGAGGGVTIEDATRHGFVILGEEPGVEIVLGIVGKFWRPRGNVHRIEPERFTRFDDAGYAKAAWNFRVVAKGTARSTVVTHTRVVCTDAAARRAMGRYWLLIRPFSGMIRRRALALIKRTAERDSMNES